MAGAPTSLVDRVKLMRMELDRGNLSKAEVLDKVYYKAGLTESNDGTRVFSIPISCFDLVFRRAIGGRMPQGFLQLPRMGKGRLLQLQTWNSIPKARFR